MSRTKTNSETDVWKNVECPGCGNTNIGWQNNCLICHFVLREMNTQPGATKETNTCRSCGGSLKPNTKFCIHCGAKSEQPSAQQTCPGCGADIASDLKFCLQCGRRL